MLDLSLSEIYRRVFHLWKSIDLYGVLVGGSCPYQLFFFLVSSRAFRDAPHSRFRCGNLNQCLPNVLKMLLLLLLLLFLGGGGGGLKVESLKS